MKKFSENSRPNVYKAQERLAKSVLRLLKINPLRLSRSFRSRKNQRSRQDQLTIEILRFRVDHPDAMQEQAGQTIYSDAFKDFILSRYNNEAYAELTPAQFSRAAGIPVELLNACFAPARGTLSEESATPLPEEKVLAHASGVSTRLSEHFEKWLSVTRDFLHATGDELGWRAHQIKRVLSKVISVMIRVLPKRLTYHHYDKIAELTPATMLITGYSGTQALKQSYQKNLSRGLAISMALHLSALGMYWVVYGLIEPEPPVRAVRLMMYPDLESKIEEKSGSPGAGENNRAGLKNGRASLPPLGNIAESNTLLHLRVLSADQATKPPGPNATESIIGPYTPTIDVAGLQELANQGIPSSIAGTGSTPLMHFIPKAGKTPKIDLASIGGEDGAVLPSNTVAGVQARLVGFGSTGSANGSSFNPTFAASSAGQGGSGSIGERYSTGRPGSLHPGDKTEYRSRNPEPGTKDHRTGNAGPDKIPLKSSGQREWKSRDLKKLFHELLEWMAENPYEFPPVLKHYMRFKKDDVTARVAISTVENDYELFMLCNEASEDFGLLLVAAGDSTSAICLRDTGFRKQSFYLSKGVAGRNENHEVASVSMLEQRPTIQETSKFYDVFISWWDKMKAGGQKKS